MPKKVLIYKGGRHDFSSKSLGRILSISGSLRFKALNTYPGLNSMHFLFYMKKGLGILAINSKEYLEATCIISFCVLLPEGVRCNPGLARGSCNSFSEPLSFEPTQIKS